jgi:hypothetical protein
MTSPTATRWFAEPGRATAALAVVAAGLVAAFVAAPPAILGGVFSDEQRLTGAFREAFVGYWRTGRAGLPPDLDRIVADWSGYHLAKVVVAVVLLGVSVALAVLVGRAFVRSGGAVRALCGGPVAGLALASLAAVMANAQGLLVPFGSLFPLLVEGATDDDLAAVLEPARQQLAGTATGPTPPALPVMISEFSRYHVAMAVIAAVVALVLVGASARRWRGFAVSRDRRARRVQAWWGVLTTSVALAAIVLAVANAGVAADPVPGLLGLLRGGW